MCGTPAGSSLRDGARGAELSTPGARKDGRARYLLATCLPLPPPSYPCHVLVVRKESYTRLVGPPPPPFHTPFTASGTRRHRPGVFLSSKAARAREFERATPLACDSRGAQWHTWDGHPVCATGGGGVPGGGRRMGGMEGRQADDAGRHWQWASRSAASRHGLARGMLWL